MTEIVPNTIAAGVNFNATAWRSTYSGAEWTMRLFLRGRDAIDLEADRDGARHVWDVPAAVTAEWTPGSYSYVIRVTNGTDAFDVEHGHARITPDIAAAAAGYDGRSQARTALEAIDAVLAKRATMDQQQYRINNRELARTSIPDLLKLRAHYVELVRREDAKRRGQSLFGRQVKFVPGLR